MLDNRAMAGHGEAQQSRSCEAKRTTGFDGLKYRLPHDKVIKYQLMAQLAEKGDKIDDSTKVWSCTNDFAETSEVVVNCLWEIDGREHKGREKKTIINDPFPRSMEDVEVSDDHFCWR